MFSVFITYYSKIRELNDENNHPKPSQTIIHLWDPVWHHHSTCHHSKFSIVCGSHTCNFGATFTLFFSLQPLIPKLTEPKKKKKNPETRTQWKKKKKKKKPPSVKGKRKKRRWRNQTHQTQWRKKKEGQKLRLTLTVGSSM